MKNTPPPATGAAHTAAWFSDPDTLQSEVRTHLASAAGLGQIPGYELHEQISSGGQGAVYAGSANDSGRAVAIKVLAEGLFSSDTARRRFEREIEVVGDLRHPNIIGTLDFGRTEEGLAYLVMPRIDGEALDVWADRTRQAGDIRAIVELFARLCEAIQFAHQHGVIHRDLKPGNVLVDRDRQPYVLDFGLAKLTDARAGTVAGPTMTREGQFVGSLPWTSPEQLRGEERSVDVRTDTYALGVMLYQGLTGQAPYPVEGTLPVVVHSVVNVAPGRPSGLNPKLPADLDAIALKALEKSPEARYQTAGAFARDLRRFLDNEPIMARRERARQALQRNVRRYQAITLVSGALLAIAVLFYVRAAADRDRAATEARKAQASADFLQNLLAGVDPRKHGLDVTVAELLNDAAAEIPQRFAEQPEVAATLEFMLARAYGNVGLNEQCYAHMERAWELRRAVLGDSHLDTLDVAFNVATGAPLEATRRDAVLQQVARERRRQLGANHRETLRAEFYLLWMTGSAQPTRAIAGLTELTARATEHLDADDRLLHRIQLAQAEFELRFGDVRTAESRCRAMLASLESLPDPDYEHRLGAARVLAEALLVMERFDEAIGLLEHGLAAKQRVLGKDHPAAHVERVSRVRWLIAMGRLEEAEAALRSLAESSPVVAIDQMSGGDRLYQAALAQLLTAQGRHARAIEVLHSWIEQRTADLGGDHPIVRRQECLLVTAQVAAGRYEEAGSLAAALLTYFASRPIADHALARLHLDYGASLLRTGRAGEAIGPLQSAREAFERLFPRGHSWIVRAEMLLEAAEQSSAHADRSGAG